MTKEKRLQIFFLVFSFIYLSAFCFFYYKYVPLIKSFQIALVPVLLAILILTSINVRWGTLFFVFAFPLINNLPYFFGIQGDIPHAPTSLVLFLVFFLGWLFNQSFSYSKSDFDHSVFKPIIFLSLIIFASGLIGFFRYANFFPFLSDRIYELVVNVSGVRAGGALMSGVLNFLNYSTGFLFFFILFSTVKSKEFIKKLLIVLSISFLISISFSLIQKYVSSSLGNTTFWSNLNQINSTFKDPNSFGVFLAGFFPVLLGMTFFFQKKLKLLFVFLIIFALFVFPSVGSRSAFLGLIVSVAMFFLLFLVSSKITLKKKLILAVSFFLIATILFLSFVLFSKQSKLFARLDWSLVRLENRASLNSLFTGRLDFWAAASRMIADYPFTGVGLGAYIVELPNYAESMKLGLRVTDSAENYFFQAGSELGLIGLILFVWLFYEVAKQMRRGWKIPDDDKDRFILIGSISGLIAIFVNYLFHSYVGAFDVKYFFWFLVALVFVYPRIKGKPDNGTKLNRKFGYASVVLFLSFGFVQLWNSTHSLSLKNEAEKYGWIQNFGFYQQEKDNREFYFKWAKKSAGMAVDNIGKTLVIPIMASHPDIKRNPVKVSVFLADSSFRKRELLKEILLNDTDWVDSEYSLSEYPERKIYFIFETDRIWQPLHDIGIPDPRWLAFGLGMEWFRYPATLPSERIKDVQRISSEKWEGKFNKNLLSNGISQIKFRVDDGNTALRLWVKGQKAFDIGPYIIIRLDNRVIGKTQLLEDDWTALILTSDISKGEHVLSVEFINDISEPESGNDRNVFLGDIDVIVKK